MIKCVWKWNDYGEDEFLWMDFHIDRNGRGFDGFIYPVDVLWRIGILYYKDQNRKLGTVSIISFIVSLIFFVLFVMADKQEFKNTIIDNEGLWQRLNLAFMYLPIAITAIIRIGK